MNFYLLSRENILSEIQDAVKQERKMTLVVLHLLREIERRQLFASEGFSSLFCFAVERLGYTEDEAQRRISAMRLLSSLPEVEERIEKGDLKLSQLAKVHTLIRAEKKAGRFLDRNEKLAVVEKVVGKSTRETDRVLLSESPALRETRRFSGPKMRIVSGPAAGAGNTPGSAEIYTELNFTVSPEVSELLDQARALMACPQEMNPSVAAIFEAGLRALIREKQKKKQGVRIQMSAPVAKQVNIFSEQSVAVPELNVETMQLSKVESIAVVKCAQDERSKGCGVKPQLLREVPRPTSRFIPISLKRAVFGRAGGRCEFRAENGRRCESAHALELHHEQNWSEGGGHTFQNLAVYCRTHNAARAQSDFPWVAHQYRS
jgi:hypothetical protein